MDPAFRGAVTDSDGRPFRMTWYMEMDDFIAKRRHADGPPDGLLTLYDELQHSWGEELRGFGDEIAYHHHFMRWDGARWRQAGTSTPWTPVRRARPGPRPHGARRGFLPRELPRRVAGQQHAAPGVGRAPALLRRRRQRLGDGVAPVHPAAADYTASGEMEHWMVNIPGGPTQAGADSAFAQALAEGPPRSCTGGDAPAR